mmetsp:Transcript_37900/g.52568  ORF Transcript_37900/g.52568 Transcript_37900/m.52568 type:complete len:159 (+) Transcript_37900:94-570(+)|eukprot:CAMPEP_0201488396 /NCGR_PEP_ID=MMETSP0151_2-20130828/17960_1 /ASSEMBLY_ACC=CAM_ASM_000257 /TAXON_ID=200890 /ORGANISM="Paramoeba atlantica, Strain 621/1 / CCAP 1560/9" /LENGTH=158 /DNA_ID=CAMNT_0047873671 /DNA_START=83 /DNA_END=559 /DNA_ORIENTATION=+
MAATTCMLDPEVKEAFQDLLSRKAKNSVLILKCNLQKGTVVLDDEILEEISPVDLAAELPDSSPRFVLYRYYVSTDETVTQEYKLFIYFNPMNTDVRLKRSYQTTKDQIIGQFPKFQFLQLNQIEDFRDSKIQALALGNTGEMGERLDAKFETYGRQY